ncbi:MAG: hypothetical protein ACRDSP_05820 [Pseudonocardiaceae bacterium]
MGCPTGPEFGLPGRRGSRQEFLNGQLVWSPDQGPNMMNPTRNKMFLMTRPDVLGRQASFTGLCLWRRGSDISDRTGSAGESASSSRVRMGQS